jgi:hypothetical protein
MSAIAYSSNELSILKECFQLTGTMLSNFINFVKLVEKLSNDVDEMIQVVDNVNVPYCYEYIRLEYQVIFNEIKGNVDDLKTSMFYFPEEVERFLDYIKNEPSSNSNNEVFDMMDETYQYYCARYGVIITSFNDSKNNAFECYDAAQHLPRPCGA